jgi:hypothetical protein
MRGGNIRAAGRALHAHPDLDSKRDAMIIESIVFAR